MQALRAKREAAIRQGAPGADGPYFAGVPSGVRLADTGGDTKAQDQLGAVFMKYSSKQPRTAALAQPPNPLDEGRFRALGGPAGTKARQAETPGK